jgi:hypothetical protein
MAVFVHDNLEKLPEFVLSWKTLNFGPRGTLLTLNE